MSADPETRAGQEPPEQSPDWLEQIDHTADSGIIVWADTIQELFGRAAWGMFAVITSVNDVRPIEMMQVTVEASDHQALLVRWLSELNFRHITQHRVFCRFEILELSEMMIKADVYGEPIDVGRHTIYTEIKAVTFHGLQIEKMAERWKAQIIFDL
jgi:SHS2 domain-containing protein